MAAGTRSAWIGAIVGALLVGLDGAGAAIAQDGVTRDDLDERVPMRLAGDAWVWWYQPTMGDTVRGRVELWAFALTLDKENDWGGAHVEARARDTKFRPFFGGSVWLQEAYGFAQRRGTRLKIGKMYRRVGLFSDGSFVGSVAYYDGQKLDPDLGIALEQTQGTRLVVHRELQFFRNEDRVNASLGADSTARDAEGESDAHERNTWVAHVTAERAGGWFIRPGLTLATGDVVRDDGSDDDVTWWGGELAVSRGADLTGTRLYGEVLVRNGVTARHFPVEGGAPTAIYWEVGAAKVGNVGELRYNLSGATYRHTGVRELMHQPGLSIALGRHSAFIVEWSWWRRFLPGGGSVTVDKSFNFVLRAGL